MKEVTNLLKLQMLANNYYRKGIPDSLKRNAFLNYFDLTPEKWKITYKAIHSLSNMEEFEIIEEDKPSFVFFNKWVLNDQGIKNLENIVYMLSKEKHIEYSPLFIHSVEILLIYMPVEEAFWVAQKMMANSAKLLGDLKKRKYLRWHFTFTKADYFHMIGAFIQSYIDITYFKKRSIILRLQQIGYDISELLDEMFKYFFTSFHRIDIVTDIFTNFVFDGVRVLFRFAYASLKIHKEDIKAVETPKLVRDVFEYSCQYKTTWNYLHEMAFIYPLS